MSTISSINQSRRESSLPVILLFGPTGVGKTELLLRQFSKGFEVISADSMQVYRGLDIGTAKPEARELSCIPHHLIDIRNPSEQFHVGDFVYLADALVNEILSRGNVPVISGGTAFYFKHFLYGLPPAPKADPRVRWDLQKQLETMGLAVLYNRLKETDPAAARSIAPGDAYRILRALEVFYTSGKPLSAYPVPDKVRSHLNPAVIGLTRNRDELYRRIDLRVRTMMQKGLYAEVCSLMRNGARPDWPGMKGIGYREFFLMRESGELSIGLAEKLIARNSRQYAKQQLTFFRSLPGVRWEHPDQFPPPASLVPAL